MTNTPTANEYADSVGIKLLHGATADDVSLGKLLLSKEKILSNITEGMFCSILKSGLAFFTYTYLEL